MFCPKCGWKIRVEGSRFCDQCGARLPDKIPTAVRSKQKPSPPSQPSLSHSGPPKLPARTSQKHTSRPSSKHCETCGKTIKPGEGRFPSPYQMRQPWALAERLSDANKLGAWQSKEAFADEVESRTSNWRLCSSCQHFIVRLGHEVRCELCGNKNQSNKILSLSAKKMRRSANNDLADTLARKGKLGRYGSKDMFMQEVRQRSGHWEICSPCLDLVLSHRF